MFGARSTPRQDVHRLAAQRYVRHLFIIAGAAPATAPLNLVAGSPGSLVNGTNVTSLFTSQNFLTIYSEVYALTKAISGGFVGDVLFGPSPYNLMPLAVQLSAEMLIYVSGAAATATSAYNLVVDAAITGLKRSSAGALSTASGSMDSPAVGNCDIASDATALKWRPTGVHLTLESPAASRLMLGVNCANTSAAIVASAKYRPICHIVLTSSLPITLPATWIAGVTTPVYAPPSATSLVMDATAMAELYAWLATAI